MAAMKSWRPACESAGCCAHSPVSGRIRRKAELKIDLRPFDICALWWLNAESRYGMERVHGREYESLVIDRSAWILFAGGDRSHGTAAAARNQRCRHAAAEHPASIFHGPVPRIEFRHFRRRERQDGRQHSI